MITSEINGVAVAGGYLFVCDRCGMRRVATHASETHFCGVDVAFSARRHMRDMAPTQGPGTELKALLKTVGIVASPTCSCNARARVMDEKGCDWCENNIDQIVGWLREEAEKRKLPFVDLGGKLLVRRAIRNARKKANSQ